MENSCSVELFRLKTILTTNGGTNYEGFFRSAKAAVGKWEDCRPLSAMLPADNQTVTGSGPYCLNPGSTKHVISV
jgi:hypothetical protein